MKIFFKFFIIFLAIQFEKSKLLKKNLQKTKEIITETKYFLQNCKKLLIKRGIYRENIEKMDGENFAEQKKLSQFMNNLFFKLEFLTNVIIKKIQSYVKNGKMSIHDVGNKKNNNLIFLFSYKIK